MNSYLNKFIRKPLHLPKGLIREKCKTRQKNFQNNRNFFLVESQNSYLCNPKNDKPSGENVEKEKDR